MVVISQNENSVDIEFRRTVLPYDIEALCEFDRQVFGSYPDDLFPPEDWAELESYWVIVDGERIGCIALKGDVDYHEEPRAGSLYIESTGILPKYQGKGFGALMKEWQIDHAKRHGFDRIVTNTRTSNVASIRLNEKFGFRIREKDPDYYSNPNEAAIVLELDIKDTYSPFRVIPVEATKQNRRLQLGRLKQDRECMAAKHGSV